MIGCGKKDWIDYFIKAAGLASGAVFLSNRLSGTTLNPTENPHKPVLHNGVLNGVCDLHIHAAPDIKERTVNELELCRTAKETGYKAVMFKSNVWSCHDRAYIVRQALPGFACFGSLVMNLAFGERVNIHTAKQALNTSGNLCRCIWMPTQDASYPPLAEAGHTGKTIPVADTAGIILPEVVQVMELCAEADIIFATGHSSPDESLAMARTAKEIGLKRFVITHANSRIWKLTHDQIRQAVDLGAWIEYCYLPRLWGPGTGLPNMERQTKEEFLSYIRLVPERSFVSTDLGSAGLPDPVTGMGMCIEEMASSDVPQQEIAMLVRKNPAWLLNLTE